MDINKAIMLARHARFSRVKDYHRDAYTATVGGFFLVLEHVPRDTIVSGGFGLEHDDRYLLTVFKHEQRVCTNVFTKRELVGTGSFLHADEEGDARVKTLFASVSHGRQRVLEH